MAHITEVRGTQAVVGRALVVIERRLAGQRIPNPRRRMKSVCQS
jgi:hypothetical protein